MESGRAGKEDSVSLCFQGPYYWVLKGPRALTIGSLEAQDVMSAGHRSRST